MATNPRQILTSVHGRKLGLNHAGKLVVPSGYIIEGTPKAILEFDSNGLAAESLAAYGQFSSDQNQIPVSNDTPVLVLHHNQDLIFGMQQSVGSGFTFTSAGRYMVVVGGQIAKASGSALRNLALWLRKNNVDIPRSSVVNGITSLDTTVLILNYFGEFAAGDNLKVYMSTPDVTGSIGLYASAPTNVPAVPSVITSIFKVR